MTMWVAEVKIHNKSFEVLEWVVYGPDDGCYMHMALTLDGLTDDGTVHHMKGLCYTWYWVGYDDGESP